MIILTITPIKHLPLLCFFFLEIYLYETVNVDDAVDDIVRQFKGVSDGLMRKVVGSSPNPDEASSSSNGNFSFKADEISTHIASQSTYETVNSFSDHEEDDKDESYGHEKVTSGAQASVWHSGNELNSKGVPPRIMKNSEDARNLNLAKRHSSDAKSEWFAQGGLPAAKFSANPDRLKDPIGMPPEVPCISLASFPFYSIYPAVPNLNFM